MSKLIDSYETGEPKALDFAQGIKDGSIQLKDGQTMLQGYQSYLQSTTKSLSLANIKTKALTVSMKVFSTIGWMAIMTFAMKAIGKGIEAIGDYIHRVERANEAMSAAASEYDSVKSGIKSINTELDEQNKKIDELQAKDKLTYAERGQLEELQEITKELLLQQDIEEKRAERASKDVAEKAVEAYEKQYGKFDTSKDDLSEKFDHVEWSGQFPIPESENDITGNIAAMTRAKELLSEEQQKYAAAVANGEDTTWIESEIQRYTDMSDDFSSSLDKSISDLEDKRVALSEEYTKAVEKQVSGLNPLSSYEKDSISTYESIANAIKLIYEYTDPNSWNSIQIDTLFNTEGIEKTKEDLVEMAKSGTLTPETLASYINLNNAIKESDLILEDEQTAVQALCNEMNALADSADEVSENLNITPTLSISSTIDQLNTQLKPAFDSLKSAYQDIFTEKDGKEIFTLENVDLSMLDSIKSSLDDMGEKLKIDVDYSEYENLVKVLTNSSSTADEVQQSMNRLAQSVLDNTDVLQNFNGESYKTVQSMLETLGVANSESVMLATLGYSYKEYTEAKVECTNAGFDLANATDAEIAKFIEEQGGADNCGVALANLQLKKILVNSTQITTATDIAQILSLAKAANISSQSLVALAAAKEQFETASANGDKMGMSLASRGLKEIGEKVKNDLLNYEPVAVDFAPTGKKSASKAGKETADAYLDSYKKELSELDHLHEMGIIADGEYLNRLNMLNEKYFNDNAEHQKKYLDEYQSNQEKVYKGLQSLYKELLNSKKDGYDSALKAIDKLLDGEIDKLNELKDASKDSYESQIDDIDKKISRLEKERDARKKTIQDQIDAIKEEKEELDRLKALEDARYEAKRAQNQKSRTYQSVDGEDGQVIYKTDSKKESDAADAVDKAKDDIKLAELEKELDSLDSYYDNLISNLESQQDSLKEKMDAVTASYESQIKQLEGNKQRYADIATAQEDSENKMMATALLGSNWQQLILSGRLDVLDAFKGSYLGICNEISGADTAFGLDASTAAEGYAQSISDMLTKTTSLETLLQSWKDLNTGLGSVIGVGGSSGEGSSTSNGEAGKGQGNTGSESNAGADTIIGAVQSGGLQMADTLTNQWVPAWQDVGNNMNTICGGIVSSVNEMASSVVESCKQAINAINMANAAKDSSSSSNATPNFSASSYVGKRYSKGTDNAKKGINLVGEDGYELYEDNKGNVSLATEPTLIKMQGGEKVTNNEESKKLLDSKNSSNLNPEATAELLKYFGEADENGMIRVKSLENPVLTEQMKNLTKIYNPSAIAMQSVMSRIPDYSNIATARSQEVNVHQDINVTIPNLDGESAFHKFERGLEQMQLDAVQRSYRR